MFSRILHPTDLSDASAAAHSVAHELAKSLGAKLLVCYIATPPVVVSGDELTDPATGETRNIRDEVHAQQSPDPAVDCEVKVVMADTSAGVKTILGVLENMNCDLIVLGMHKRSGVAGWMKSSVTEEVVRRAHCPVLVVKKQDKDS
jgi:nucleotide-binding universal stress UspA family protein